MRTRLTSSGIERSKERRPASTWASGIRRWAQARAAARVELTSPGTITSSGASASSTGSIASSTAASIRAWVPEPTPSMWSGSGTPSSSRKTSDIIRS